jgi:hypothetical protein
VKRLWEQPPDFYRRIALAVRKKIRTDRRPTVTGANVAHLFIGMSGVIFLESTRTFLFAGIYIIPVFIIIRPSSKDVFVLVFSILKEFLRVN